MSKIQIAQADICTLSVDMIVCPTIFEENLQKTNIETRIHQKAGSELLKEKQILAHLTNQYPQITKGYKLFAKQVLHISFPHTQQESAQDKAKLSKCYKEALKIAIAAGAKSVGFPCFEIEGFSQKTIANIAYKTTKNFLLNNFKLEKVYFVDLDTKNLEPYKVAALAVKEPIKV